MIIRISWKWFRRSFFFLAGILILVFSLIHIVLNQQENDYKHFQKSLLEKEVAMQGYLFLIRDEITNTNLALWMKDRAGLWEERFEEEGFAIVIFRNDSLRYWSDNSFTPPFQLDFYKQTTPVDFVDNTFLIKKTINVREYLICGFVKIKNRFPIHNRFLNSNYAPGFNLSSNTKLSIEKPLLFHYDVKNSRGEAIFYLIPESDNFSGKSLINLIPDFLFILIAFAIFLVSSRPTLYKNTNFIWIVSLLIIILLRGLFSLFESYSFLHLSVLGNPSVYSQSALFGSLADAIYNGLVLLLFALIFYKNFRIGNSYKKSALSVLIPTIVLLTLYTVFIHYQIRSLILDSTINYNLIRIYELDGYAFPGFAVMLMMLGSWMFISYAILRESYKIASVSLLRLLILVLFGISVILSFFVPSHLRIPVLAYSSFIGIFSYSLTKAGKLTYSRIVFLLFFTSAFLTSTILQAYLQRNYEKNLTYLQNFSNARNAILEFQIIDFFKKIKLDSRINDFLVQSPPKSDELRDYILNSYFNDKLSVFDSRIFLCGPGDSIFVEKENRLSPCSEFFNSLIKSAVAIQGTQFYYIDDISGLPGYVGSIDFFESSRGLTYTLFFDLRTKLRPNPQGYPELLTEGNSNSKNGDRNFSLARYKFSSLITQTGTFPYPTQLSGIGNINKQLILLKYAEYEHIILTSDSQNSVVLSLPAVKPVDLLISFLYVFVFLIFSTSIILFLLFLFSPGKVYYPGLRNRIIATMIIVLTISLIIVGISTTYYIIRQNDEKNREALNEKIQSVLVEIENKLFNESSLDFSRQVYLTNLLIKFSNVFFSDINIYLPDGNLLASSRPEIFSNHLTGTQMNTRAYRSLVVSHSGQLIQTEQIGSQRFLSAYLPFRNRNNEILAYINLPYFTKQSALREELVSSVMAIVNIYVFLIIISVFAAILITGNLTRPLLLIKEKISGMQLDKPAELIDYQSHDEIGELIKEYNRMVSVLAESAEKLAQSERESAWREMARQVAHEIKNPLTPMKLMTQHLQRAWNEKPADLDERIARTTNLLIDQIDALSAIATEFSNFAKIPQAKNQHLDLAKVITRAVSLFEPEGIQIKISLAQNSAFVWADPEQLYRVFLNLFKNASQAMEGSNNGRIYVSLERYEQQFQVIVRDEGSGIEAGLREKLFQPNFTTKSSGMGLGLAISRNIIELAGGSIHYFEPDGQGSAFKIHLPVFKDPGNENINFSKA